MSAALAKPEAVPIGVIKQFGPHGPEYEVLGIAAPENGEAMIEIVLVRTGETLTYPLHDALQDQEAS